MTDGYKGYIKVPQLICQTHKNFDDKKSATAIVCHRAVILLFSIYNFNRPIFQSAYNSARSFGSSYVTSIVSAVHPI